MSTLPPVTLGAIVFGAFLLALMARRPLEKALVTRAVEHFQARRQFWVDLALCFLVGVLGGTFNDIAFGFPMASAISLLIGCLVMGFFIGLDTALAREREVIRRAIARNATQPPSRRLYSMTRKFSLTAMAALILFSVIFISVLARDIIWLAAIGKEPAALSQAQRSVSYEVIFIVGVFLALVVNLIISYAQNLNLLFANETDVLERVSNGDLSRKVPVATNDEFGYIASHTNHMIEGLRHRSSLMDALKMAEEVQQNLLPKRPPQWEGLDISGISIYCDDIGGDYYDYFKLANGKFGVVVADAAGHGIGAAMQMTATRAFLHSSIGNFQSLVKLMERINYYVTRDSGQTSRFVSLFFLEIDPQQKKLSWVRAGHEPGFLYDPTLDRFTELAGEGMALGVVANYDYQITTSQNWALGSVLVIATDGVYETRNDANEMFGAQRLRELIRQEAEMPAATIQDRILAALKEFRGTSRAEDDLTIIVIKLL
jgi:sigma-B regulation protein RsbU (phosphoserine phosphatase)